LKTQPLSCVAVRSPLHRAGDQTPLLKQVHNRSRHPQ
jgi:hypothetical protein